jgi:hydroxypyruvate isomerase
VSPFRLAVSAEMVFLDLPFTERVRRIAELGFEARSGTGPLRTSRP